MDKFLNTILFFQCLFYLSIILPIEGYFAYLDLQKYLNVFTWGHVVKFFKADDGKKYKFSCDIKQSRHNWTRQKIRNWWYGRDVFLIVDLNYEINYGLHTEDQFVGTINLISITEQSQHILSCSCYVLSDKEIQLDYTHWEREYKGTEYPDWVIRRLKESYIASDRLLDFLASRHII